MQCTYTPENNNGHMAPAWPPAQRGDPCLICPRFALTGCEFWRCVFSNPRTLHGAFEPLNPARPAPPRNAFNLYAKKCASLSGAAPSVPPTRPDSPQRAGGFVLPAPARWVHIFLNPMVSVSLTCANLVCVFRGFSPLLLEGMRCPPNACRVHILHIEKLLPVIRCGRGVE